MAWINSTEELRNWLKGKPPQWAQVLAVRAAMRALPYISVGSDTWLTKFAVLPFGALITSWMQIEATGGSVFVRKDASRANARFGGEAFDFQLYKSEMTACLAADASYHSADAQSGSMHVISDCVEAVSKAAEAVRSFSDLTVPDGSSEQTEAAFWRRVTSDCEWLQNQPKETAVDSLAVHSLWPESPSFWDDMTRDLSSSLLNITPGYRFWIDWYERRIQGERAAFDIPHDQHRREDIWLLRKIADATNEDFWNRGAEYVNGKLTRWLDEARARAAEHRRHQQVIEDAKNLDLDKIFEELFGKNDKEETGARLQFAASPKFRDADGKLDAGANTKFDQPKYSGDLADLPATLQSFARTLANSLGRNASAFLRSSLAEYENELRVRGPRPILGPLIGQAISIAHEVYTSESLEASNDPATWVMIDEREWGSGAAKLFRIFFSYHSDLIDHFPLDEEREELYRDTPIDEAAAKGDALTKPLEIMAEIIDSLHSQGMATDDIVKIIGAMKEYTAHVAAMPSPPPGTNPKHVSPQKRTTLNNTGVIMDFYTFLGSSASLDSWVQQNQDLMAKVYDAAVGMQSLLR